jgi:glutamate-1-semialdehyde 2,1-aminomutase
MQFDRSRALQARSHEIIPGGAHTYAKGDDQYPEEAPVFIVRGDGCHVWDADGNEFIEYGAGIRSVTLGHGFRPVVDAVARQLPLGTNFNRPTPLEIECAEQIVGQVHSAEMVKFAKNGSDVTTAAVRLARAFTGRDLVAVCVDHPFFSTDDWFIGTTPMAAGIPECICRLTLGFHYNDIASVEALFAEHPGHIAALIMEAERTEPPADGFLPAVQRLCHEHGALFILDEIITGYRWHVGGAQAVYGVRPDLSTFGKGMANGFSVSALVGSREIMRLGGWHHDRDRVFLLSTTHGAETHALAAALETMRTYDRHDVVGHLYARGRELAEGIGQITQEFGIAEHFGVIGRPCNLLYYTRDGQGQPSQPFRTLFLQETMRRGLLMPSLAVSFSHTVEDIARTLDGIRESLVVYRHALEDGVERHLAGRPVKPAVRARN